MNLILKNIKCLYTIANPDVKVLRGKEMSNIDFIENAFLIVQDHKIRNFGTMHEFSVLDISQFESAKTEIKDCSGKIVFPGFVDSHTHIIFSHTREEEFVQRIKGRTYEEIAASGGGILNSAARLSTTSEDELFESAMLRLLEIMATGTVAVEIKSGYGLSLESELKMLRVAQRLKNSAPLKIKTTLLAAHALPKEYKNNRSGFIKLVCEEMIPNAAEEKLADYVDVFCETGFFTPEETAKILETGNKFGIKGRVHANELDFSGGVQAGVSSGAISVDHLECIGDNEIDCLLNSNTLPTILPATAFFLKIPYAPARKMIDTGLPVVLASDFNPGTCPTGNIPLVISIAVTQMKMTPTESLVASTLHGATALELSDTHGKICKGMDANLIISKPVNSFNEFPYFFGTNLVLETIITK